MLLFYTFMYLKKKPPLIYSDNHFDVIYLGATIKHLNNSFKNRE